MRLFDFFVTLFHWLFDEPTFDVAVANLHHRALLAEMRDELW